MLIAIEGNEGSGKTTLAKRIVEVLDGLRPDDTTLLVHSSAPKQGATLESEYLHPLSNYTPYSGVNYVFDRYHWGEDVYPNIVGRLPLGLARERAIVARKLANLGMLVVYIRTTPDVCRERIHGRGEHEPMFEHLDAIHRMYEFRYDMRSSFERVTTQTDPFEIINIAAKAEVLCSV